MKLELKHYAAYLPYQLKYIDLKQLPNVFLLDAKTLAEIINDSDRLNTIAFLLRPLSDLTREIEHNGEKFVPIEWLEDRYYTLDIHDQAMRLVEDFRWINHCEYLLIQHLLEWHFDIYGLIEAGVAVDINNLKTQEL